jgi:autotransporter-associated beta strand protein
MKRSRNPKLISRACLFAAAALLTVGAPPTARAANIFLDQNGATAGTGATGAVTWNLTTTQWVNAGAATTIPGTAAAVAYTFTNADTMYVTGGTVQTMTLSQAVTLNGINDATGMTITSNTLTMAGTTPTITVASGKTTTIGSVLAGTAGLTKAGAGTLVLNTNAKTYTGNTTVSAGVLSLGFGGGAGSIRGTVTVASGAQLVSTATDSSGYTAGTKLDVINLTGNGTLAALSHTAAGNFGWGVTYNLTGAIMQTNGGTNNATTASAFSFGMVSAGTVTKVVTVANANESKILGRIILRENNANNRVIFDTADGAAAVDLRVGAFVTESAAGFGIEKTGAGLMLLEQDNSFSGETHILGGRLQISGDLKLGTAPTAASATKLTFNNGGLLNTTATMTLNANRGTTLTGNGGFDVNSGTTLTYAGIIAGAGVLQKTGAGTLVLSGANTFTGGVNLIGGTVQIDSAARFGTNQAMNFNNGGKLVTTATMTLAGANTFTGNGEIAPTRARP